MICPFCKEKLKVWRHDLHTTYGCDKEDCAVDDMPRYQISYWNYPTRLVGCTFMLDQYYIQVNYEAKQTTISTLYVCFLKDPITIPAVLAVNFKKQEEMLHKIRTWLLFS